MDKTDSGAFQRDDGEAVTGFMQRLESCPDLPAITFVKLLYGGTSH